MTDVDDLPMDRRIEYEERATILEYEGDLTVEEAIGWLDEQGFRYEYEERAAILEYDGGLSCDDAEKQALQEINLHKVQVESPSRSGADDVPTVVSPESLSRQAADQTTQCSIEPAGKKIPEPQYDPAIKCPHCGRHKAFSGEFQARNHRMMYKCNNCHLCFGTII